MSTIQFETINIFNETIFETIRFFFCILGKQFDDTINYTI